MASANVFDVTAKNFAVDVVERSQRLPVLLDFWADWCAPCRTLGPVLEALAEEYGGSFMLGKVDAQKEAELAAAFQVRNIPLVVLMLGGRPVDGFNGALPEREVRAFLARAGVEPAAAVQAAEQEAAGAAAKLAQAKRAIIAGDVASARRLLGEIEADSAVAGERDRLLEGLALFETTLDPAASPAAAALARARDAIRQRRVEAAMEHILESLAQDRATAGGLGRKAMLLCFSLLGEDSELSSEYRRRLATLLY